MSSTYQIQQAPRTIEDAESPAKERLEEALAAYGFVPNMYAHMANMPPVLDMYIQGYEGFRNQSGFTPVEQEVVFLSISKYNGCTYCLAAHSFIADAMSGVPTEVTDAIRAGEPIGDAKLQTLSSFTVALLESQGRPDATTSQAFLAAGFSESQLLAIINAIAVKTLSNWSNHLTQPALDEAFAARAVTE